MNVVLDNLDQFLTGMQQTGHPDACCRSRSRSWSGLSWPASGSARCRRCGRWARSTSRIIRNTPLPVLMFLFFFGVPEGRHPLLAGSRRRSSCSPPTPAPSWPRRCGRASTRSPWARREAARALGLSFPQVFGVVILPQALRTVVQPLGSIFIALIKNSALATVIGVPNLTKTAVSVSVPTPPTYVPVYLGAAVAYLLLTIPSGQAVGWIERRVAIKR